QYEGTVKLDQGQIDNARLQLIYSRVTAPISGRTGVRLVDPGNIVHATDTTGIVVINQIDPIAVLFTVPEEKFQSINQAIRNNGVNPLAVQAFAREDGSLLATGKVILINNQIDTATGTVQLKALFPNATHRLWPGQYVNTHVILGTREHAVTVPETVVQRGPNGLYAFVVKSDATVAVQ